MRRTLFVLVVSSLWLVVGSALAQDGEFGVSRQPVCCGATCCLIDAVCRSQGQMNPLNPCQVCDPLESQAAWTDVTGCSADAGPAPTDAGARTDAGTPPARDAGPTGGGGGGCTVSSASTTATPALGAVLALALFVVRRRR